MKKYTFHVHGMHCRSCELMIDSELGEHPMVRNVTARLSDHTVEVEGEFGDMSPEAVAGMLSVLVADKGYTLSLERKKKIVAWNEFKIALPIALGFVAVFILLQKMGIVNLVNVSDMTYGTAFVIGIVASLSTCMAVVGGLLLSMSATFAKEGDKVKPQVLFHIGRLISFFVLGGVIGAIGSAFTLNSTATFVLNILIAIVMVVLGIHLLDVFHASKKIQLAMPPSVSKMVMKVSRVNHTVTPFLVGVATFFLPCGFTQAMQFYTLSTGSFLNGGITMLAFALGTLPVLMLVSFSSLGIKKSNTPGTFFKVAGLIVIAFAILNLVSSLIAVGIIPPILNI